MSNLCTIAPEPETGRGETSGLARYQVLRELGRGTTGVVHEAYDVVLGQTVALKTVPIPPAMAPPQRHEFVRRFLAEARIVARLAHPNIVEVRDFGQDPATGALFIALEHLEGQPLAEAVTASSPLLWPEAFRIGERMADALHHAHSSGIVHRDVKPANVMLLPGGEPKLFDFGIAKVADAPGHWSIAGQLVGTPLYMSPEQAMGERVDARSDVFALGAVLYFLITGRAPFAAATIPHILLRVLNDDPPPASLLVSGVPEGVEYVLARAMAKTPGHRYASAIAMGQDIGDVLAGRQPRHRGAWAPVRASDTLPPMTLAGDAALADLEARLGEPVEVPSTALVPLWSSVGLATETRSHARLRARNDLRAAAFVVVTAAAFASTTGRVGQLAEPRSTEGLRAAHVSATAALWPEPFPMTPVFPAAAPQVRAVARPAPAAPVGAAPPTVETTVRLVPPAAGLTVPPHASHLAVEVEHSLKDGRLRLWIDDAVRLDRAVDGRSGKKATAGDVVSVEPGAHRVKLELRWDRNVRDGETTATFLPGENRRLTARLGGLLKKKIAMEWRYVPPVSRVEAAAYDR
jgi:serine/threonine-protein kinase